jgi:hypothetical protein
MTLADAAERSFAMNARTTQILLTIIAMLLALHLAYLMGFVSVAKAQAPGHVQEVLRARLIELVSANGQVVAQLHPGEDGGGNLRLRNGNGEVRVKLGSISDGAGLILMDDRTEPAIDLSVSSAGTSLVLAQQGKEKRTLVPGR